MKEYKIFHVTRNLAKHSFELDDAIHGSPLQKENTDWTLKDPDLYLQRLRSKYQMKFDNKSFNMTAEECDAYCYHRFHQRSFTYAEKISYWLQEKTPEEIDVNLPKANRQLNVLLAAIQDVNVSIVRYENFSKVRLVG
jgi:hypothetical protein